MKQSSSSLLILNAEGKIAEVNLAANALIDKLQPIYADEGVIYEVDGLLGKSVNTLIPDVGNHIDISGVDSAVSRKLAFESYRLTLTATPVSGAKGELLGAIVELLDTTQEEKVQEEVQDIVDSAKSGDLSWRINLDDKEGFFATLSFGINELLEGMSKLIDDMVNILSGMAEGDLTKSLEGSYQGQFAKLQQDTNSTIAQLTTVATEIKDSANSLSGSSLKMADLNRDLTDKTGKQAAGLGITASTMTQMSESVNQSAGNAKSAFETASAARDQADRSQQVVGEAVEAMAGIRQASDKIVNIIDVINEIAFQTNLLALNAAVEEARAGEQGGGFAVVASEVRELASRSATAAGEIKTLIADTADRVALGTELVNKSGQALSEIVESVIGITGTLQHIANATQEQAGGINEVNNAISQIERATQDNHHIVENAAEVSESVGSQAHELHGMVSFFKTN